MVATADTVRAWRTQKRASFRYIQPEQWHTGVCAAPAPGDSLFRNPFTLDDLGVFDETALQDMLRTTGLGITTADLAYVVDRAEHTLSDRIIGALTSEQRNALVRIRTSESDTEDVDSACQRVLDAFFWELTYSKTPNLYQELIEGEFLHPLIFATLAPVLHGKAVLDAGAGSGRASRECVRAGAERVYAVEPSQGLLRLLAHRSQADATTDHLLPARGRFKNLPLDDNSVDTSVVCSAFSSDEAQCGDRGLDELIRVTRPGGTVAIIWPQPGDLGWLAERGFRYAAMPMRREMRVQFCSLTSARRCVNRFYARNQHAVAYVTKNQAAAVPFSVLGINPPHELCWLRV